MNDSNYDEYSSEGQRSDKQTHSTKLVELVMKHRLFHDQFKRAFVEYDVNGHTENCALDSAAFTQRLSHQYYEKYGSVVPASAIKDAITTLTGMTLYGGEHRRSWLRTAYLDDKYYLDLCNEDWVVVEITAGEWTLIPKSLAAFRRSPISLALAHPRPRGDLEPLWDLVNIPEQARILVITYLIDCLRPNTHYPILVLEGEQGSAKSTTQRFLKMLIDPSAVLLRVPPKKIEDIYVGTGNDHLMSFNNLSRLSPELQDALCCFSTGGTHTGRTLYSNTDETIINIMSPIMLNGISGLVTRQDLMERCIYLDLQRIADGGRRTDTELDQLFEELMPQLLGALLDIMASAMALLPEVSRDNLPRMADYCLLGRAVASAMGFEPSYFDEAYAKNQLAALERGLESLSIYPALQSLLEDQKLGYSGNYQELLNRLSRYRDGDGNGWPKNSKSLATMLKRQAPALRKVGIEITFDEQRRQEGFYVMIQRRDD
jgi:hypothetical protein